MDLWDISKATTNQIILSPESIDDYIRDDSPVRVIDQYVEQLDIEELGNKAVSPSIGRPPYNPKDMLKLYLYGYLNRTRSSRRLEHEATRNIEVIWLLKKLKPDFKTIADFRKDNKKALKKKYSEILPGFAISGACSVKNRWRSTAPNFAPAMPKETTTA